MTTTINGLLADLIRDYPAEYRLRALRDMLGESVTAGAIPSGEVRYAVASTADVIADAAARIMRERFTSPCYSRQIVAPLRESGVVLPDNDAIAIFTISAIFVNRPNIFRKIQGAYESTAKQWDIVDRTPNPTPIIKANPTPIIKARKLTDEERERRRNRMKAFWAAKKGETA